MCSDGAESIAKLQSVRLCAAADPNTLPYTLTRCLQRYYWAGLRDHVHFRPDIVGNASLLVAAVAAAAGGAFNAVHYRSASPAEPGPQMVMPPSLLKAAESQAVHGVAHEAAQSRHCAVPTAHTTQPLQREHSVRTAVISARRLSSTTPHCVSTMTGCSKTACVESLPTSCH